MRAYRSRRPAGRVLAALLTVAGLGLTACGQEDGNPLAPTSVVELPDIRGPEDIEDAYSGVLNSAFVEDLGAYSGIEVTVLAEVAETVSPRAFTVTSPEGQEVEPVLVVTTEDAEGPDPAPGDQLVIAATPVNGFDAEVVADELGLDLTPEELEEWGDETFLVATALEAAS